MAAFAELDWRRIDVTAIVAFGGLATIDERRRPACREWLRRHGYTVDTLDCSHGLGETVPALGRMLHWQEQFGYVLQPDHRNLDALEDGFEFDTAAGGRVFELLGAEVAWGEDSRWVRGLLSIAQGHSRRQLALGRRFFTLLVLPQNSRLIGQAIEETTIPVLFWNPNREVHEFAR